MKVIEHKNFNSEFPESFNWETVDSIKISAAAIEIKSEIDFSFKNNDARIFVPGLRRALNILAKQAGIKY